MQFVLIQLRSVRFEAREVVKLRDGAGHHDRATRVVMAELVLVRNDVAVLIRKHCPVGEGERVTAVIETLSRSAVSRCRPDKNGGKASVRSAIPESHHQ